MLTSWKTSYHKISTTLCTCVASVSKTGPLRIPQQPRHNSSDVNKVTTPRPWPSRPRLKWRMSENATAVIWLKCGTVDLAKHLKISSNSYIQRITHMEMLVPCCRTSLLHFKYTSVSSNESDMLAQAKVMTFNAKATTLKAKATHWPQNKA